MNFKAILLTMGIAVVSQASFSQKGKPVFKNDLDSLSYCLGSVIGNSMKMSGLTSVNEKLFMQAINENIAGKDLLIKSEQANQYIQAYFTKVHEQAAKANVEKTQKFLDDNKKKEGVVTLPSGLQYKVIKDGQGESPKATDKVKVHYHGTLIDGKVFDSSVQRGEPISFNVNGVIPGWTEALQLMKVGSKWMLFIPPALAYGEQGVPGIEPNSVLIFEVELLAIEKDASQELGPGVIDSESK